MLSRAAKFNLRIKWEKCRFLNPTVDILGYIIEHGRRNPSEAKTLAVRNFPMSMDKKSVQRFLGLISYFCRQTTV